MINRLPDSTKRLLGNKKRSNKFIWVLFFIALLWFSGNFLYQHSFGYINGGGGSTFIEAKDSSISWLEKLIGKNNTRQLEQQNESLLKENAALKEQFRLGNIQFKNNDLASNYNLKEFKVIGNDNFIDTPLLYLFGGSDYGLRVGFPVLDDHGTLIGTLNSVQSQLSYVMLTPNHDSRVGARIAGTDWNGILEGNRDLRAVLQMLPLESDVKPGDQVVTDNRNPDIPAEILLGTVSSVKESDDRLFKEAILDLPYDTKKLDKIWVITGRK